MSKNLPLHYHLLLADMDLVDIEEISSAGIFGHQRKTPRVDTEVLLYGRTPQYIFANDKILSANLLSGTYSPALGVRAIMEGMKDVRQIKVFVYDLGLRWPLKSFPSYELAFSSFENDVYMEGVLPKYFGSSPGEEPTMSRETLKDLRRILAILQNNIEKTPEAEHIITECVPGGTTTAAALLMLLGEDSFNSVSSSSDPEILTRKQKMVCTLADAWRNGDRDILSVKFYMMDHFQVVLSEFLSDAEFFWARPRNVPKIILGGGVQMLAPMVYAEKVQRSHPHQFKLVSQLVEINTTPWVTAAMCETQIGRRFMRGASPFSIYKPHTIPFKLAGEKWDVYNDPTRSPREGLGLGAMLHVAESSGFSPVEVAEMLKDTTEVYEKCKA
jgi:NaMN:DMB phosphoribosyltransferase